MDTTFLGKMLFMLKNFCSTLLSNLAKFDQCSGKRTEELMAEYYYCFKSISEDRSYPESAMLMC